MKEKDLIDKGIKYIEINKVKHFLLEDVKKEYGQIKYDRTKIETVDYISADNLEEFTEFDKSIKNALNFKVKK